MNRVKRRTVIGTVFAALAIIASAPMESDASIRRAEVLKASAYSGFYGAAESYGFEIGRKWVPVKTTVTGGINPKRLSSYIWNDTYQYYDNGILNFQVDIHQFLLKYSSENIYSYMYRADLSPQHPGRNNGFMGIGSYGDNWYSHAMATSAYNLLNGASITNWLPKNKPSSSVTNVGFSIGADGVSVSFANEMTHSELSVSSETNLATNVYGVRYQMNFESYSDDYLKNDSYVRYSSVYYGGFVFRSNSYISPSVKIMDIKHSSTFYGALYHGDATDNFLYSIRTA